MIAVRSAMLLLLSSCDTGSMYALPLGWLHGVGMRPLPWPPPLPPPLLPLDVSVVLAYLVGMLSGVTLIGFLVGIVALVLVVRARSI